MKVRKDCLKRRPFSRTFKSVYGTGHFTVFLEKMSFHHIYFLSRLFLLICGRLCRAVRSIRILIVGKSENFDSPGAVQMHQKRQADGEAKQPDCAKELDSGKHADQGNHG